MKRTVRICVVTLALTACANLSTQEIARIDGWLECTECLEGQLDSVVAIGRGAVSLLGEYVRNGPPADRLRQFRARADSLHRSLVAYDSAHGLSAPPATTPVNRTDRYAANYVALYRVRSARALSRLGGSQARQALDDALALQLPPHVRALVQLARDSVRMP